jgi:predicted transglutaminase-like cysteine proteinase
MRLVLVHDTQINIDHAVLAVHHDGEWLVLDNRRSFVTEPDDELKHYTPLFALDQDGVKLFAAP